MRISMLSISLGICSSGGAGLTARCGLGHQHGAWIEQGVRVERALDRPHCRNFGHSSGAFEPACLRYTDAVLGADRPPAVEHELEHGVVDPRVVWVSPEYVDVDVPVAKMAEQDLSLIHISEPTRQ